MKIIIMVFFIIFAIWCIIVFVCDIIYSFRKKKGSEKEIIIDITEVIKQSFQEKKQREENTDIIKII